MTKIDCLIGPTCVGKSRFALDWCLSHDGEIVSADSMQVYSGLDIGTAKPSKEDQLAVKHHAIDIVDPSQNFSVPQWVGVADKAIADITKKGKRPLICGGTGLYVKALLFEHNFANFDSSLRTRLQNDAQQNGKLYMHNLLKSVDSHSAEKIDKNDTKRVLRALEIYYGTGKPKTTIVQLSGQKRYEFEMIMLDMDRAKLYNNINFRVDKMIKDGLLDEVQKLLNFKDCQCMQAIGYKEIVDYIEGNKSWDSTVDLIKQRTRNYAKRQLTFFRQFKDKIVQTI
ncbi:MAG: tRNA (adenosine(37)-N6)-dimethylallyltransferase MiaA [Clostridiales bacterium]|jgi:tRNA dimethylallyltransferase|nr:tRNA (adenosine(37)-N6)-dimethylallyltransferase MiaA [Clostridiales bacterium]